MAAAAVLGALSAHAGLGFSQPKTPHKRDLRADVEVVDRQWSKAQTSGDVAAMEKLLSDDYLGVTSTGQVLTRSQQLDRMRSRAMTMTRADVLDEKVKILSPGSAIVTSQVALEGTMDGHVIHGNFRSTRVYKKTSAGWQITSYQATPERDHAQH